MTLTILFVYFVEAVASISLAHLYRTKKKNFKKKRTTPGVVCLCLSRCTAGVHLVGRESLHSFFCPQRPNFVVLASVLFSRGRSARTICAATRAKPPACLPLCFLWFEDNPKGRGQLCEKERFSWHTAKVWGKQDAGDREEKEQERMENCIFLHPLPFTKDGGTATWDHRRRRPWR